MKLVLLMMALIVFSGCSHFKEENKVASYQKSERREIASVDTSEVVLNGAERLIDTCRDTYFDGLDSTNITLLQNKNLFFRLIPQRRSDLYLVKFQVVMLKTDANGMAKTNKVNFGNNCHEIKKCIDKFGSPELGVATQCSANGEFTADFYKP